MNRPPLMPVEKFLIAALAFQVLFVIWQIANGRMDATWDGGMAWQFSPGEARFSWELGPTALCVLMFGTLSLAGTGLALGRSPFGHLAGALVYLGQLVQVRYEGAGGWAFTFTPTLTYRIGSDESPTIAINLVALVLLVLSAAAFQTRRLANEVAAQPLPPEELLRSR